MREARIGGNVLAIDCRWLMGGTVHADNVRLLAKVMRFLPIALEIYNA